MIGTGVHHPHVISTPCPPCPCHQCTSERSSSPQRLDLWWLLFPRDPGSPKLRMVSWNLNTLGFGGDYTPLAHQLTFGEPGSLGIIIAYFIKSWDNSWETVMKFAKLPTNPLDTLSASHSFSPDGNRTVFGTSFPKRPMVMRLFSWLQQEDTVVGSSPQKTCSRNNSIKKQMCFIGNSSKCAHLALNYSGCKVLQSHLGPAWSKKTLCSIYTMRRRSFQRNVFRTKTIWATSKTFYDIKTRLVESY